MKGDASLSNNIAPYLRLALVFIALLMWLAWVVLG
jgi:hypothetical protein